jgi:flagellar operon protein
MSSIVNPALLPPGAATPPQGPASPVAPARGGKPRSTEASGPGGRPQRPFADVLASASAPNSERAQGIEGLHFSKHALQRVERRGVSLDAATLGRLSEGVKRAAGKGSRDSVVLVDGTAFVVSVSSRTVLTAVPQQHMKEQVFTNIDSAVIA